MLCRLTEHFDEGPDPLVAKVPVLVEEDVGAGLSIIEGVVVVMEVDIEGVTDRVELVVGKPRDQLPTTADGIEGLVGRGFDPVVFEGALEDAIIEAVIVGDYQLIWRVEGLDVFPNRREVRGVLDVALMDTVDLDVAPEEVGVGVDEGVKLIGNLVVTDNGQRQRAGTVALATGSLEVHGDEVHAGTSFRD